MDPMVGFERRPLKTLTDGPIGDAVDEHKVPRSEVERLRAAMVAAIGVYVERGVDEVAEEMAAILQEALDPVAVDEDGFCVNPSWSLHQPGEVICSRCGDGEGGWRSRDAKKPPAGTGRRGLRWFRLGKRASRWRRGS